MTTETVRCFPVDSSICFVAMCALHCIAMASTRTSTSCTGIGHKLKFVHTSSHIAAHQVHENSIRAFRCASGTISIDFHSSNRSVNSCSAHLLMKSMNTHNRPNRRRQRKRFRSAFSISFMLSVGPCIRCCAFDRQMHSIFFSRN